jgi:predicted RNA-binding protein with PUA-like domain
MNFKEKKMAKRYWLMKTEPETFSIQDLQKRPHQTEPWDGVRNYQARNYMRDDMRVGDEVLFYHSSCTPAGIVGIAVIDKAASQDPGALNPHSKYYDAKATPDKNPWVLVHVRFKKEFKPMVTLQELHQVPGLEKMLVIKKGMRLSIQPVTSEEFAIIQKLAKG